MSPNANDVVLVRRQVRKLGRIEKHICNVRKILKAEKKDRKREERKKQSNSGKRVSKITNLRKSKRKEMGSETKRKLRRKIKDKGQG